MKNTYSICKDENNNIHIILKIKSSKLINSILCLINICLITFYFLLLFTIPINSPKSFFLLSLFFLSILFFSSKLLLWHLFGEELLVVNGKSLSYQFNYGIYLTEIVTIKHFKLQFSYIHKKWENEESYGIIQFNDLDKETGLPLIIHSTTVQLTESECNTIMKLLVNFMNVDVVPSSFSYN